MPDTQISEFITKKERKNNVPSARFLNDKNDIGKRLKLTSA